MLQNVSVRPEKSWSRIGLGCSRLGSFNNPATTSQMRELLATACDLGVTLFDTADVYGQGDSERELGRLMRRRRDRIFVVTKAGKTFSRKMQLLRPLKPLLKPLLSRNKGNAISSQRDRNLAHDFSAAHILKAADGSLRRLGIDSLDGFLLHSPPADALTDHSLWAALATLQRLGKVRAYGVSCDTMEVLVAAVAIPGITLLELPFDLLATIEGGPLERGIRQQGVAVVAREVIRLQPDALPRDAIRRALAMAAVTSVVVGTTRIGHLKAATAAAAL